MRGGRFGTWLLICVSVLWMKLFIGSFNTFFIVWWFFRKHIWIQLVPVCYTFICSVTIFINFTYIIFPRNLKSKLKVIRIFWDDLKTLPNNLTFSTFVLNFSSSKSLALVDKLLWPQSACFCKWGFIGAQPPLVTFMYLSAMVCCMEHFTHWFPTNIQIWKNHFPPVSH